MNVKVSPILPQLPGVYIFKNKANEIIYVGKAKSLAKRVASYFRAQQRDWKVAALIEEHVCIEHIVTRNETEALLLEASLIRDNKPKYNVLLKSGNPFVYVVVTAEEIPQLILVRTRGVKGRYFGPFLKKHATRQAYHDLIRMFNLHLCTKRIPQGCLDFHLKKCAGSCRNDFDKAAYCQRLERATYALKHDYDRLLASLHEQRAEYMQRQEYEKARHVHAMIEHFDAIVDTLRTGFKEASYNDEIVRIMANEHPRTYATQGAAEELAALLGLASPPVVLDCFDISHFQSHALVGSCIRFINGIPEKQKFRRFKIQSLLEQNDYAALREIVTRRYAHADDLPDLIVIDGGKGQLSAVIDCVRGTPCIALAKQEETIFWPGNSDGYRLDIHSAMGKLLIALRDYTHHFGLRYHQLLRKKERWPS